MVKSSPQARIFSFIRYRTLRRSFPWTAPFYHATLGRMFTVNDSLVFGLSSSAGMLTRYVADLSAAEFHHRPSPNANCAAWTVGHLAMTDRNGLKRLGAPLP